MNIEAAMLDSDGRHEEAQRLFRKILEFEPESGLVWFNLGLSLDTAHKVVEAIDAYEKSIQFSDNERTRALLCLSHIYNGAQRGTCSKCDAFYAAHPEYLDKEQAFGFWKRAIVFYVVRTGFRPWKEINTLSLTEIMLRRWKPA